MAFLDELVLVALGGALGSLVRFALVECLAARFGWPAWGTIMMVNVAGGAMIAIASPMATATGMNAFLVVGWFGGFTTFSTSMLDAVLLHRSGRTPLACAIWIGTPVVGVGAWLLVTALCGGSSA